MVASRAPDAGTAGGSSRRASASESALLAALRAGDRQAAERLAAETYEMIYASLFRLTGGDRDLAADLAQETYRRAWRGLGGFDGRSRFGTWLYRIAYTTFLNHVRRPARVRAYADEEMPVAVDGKPDPEAGTLDREAAGRLRRAVLALPEELRFTVTARFWGELPVREIARASGLTAAAVRKRLKRAYLALELALEEGGA